ncbi:MAG: hypothetical protein AAGA71_06950 [Pseudomonadota bacterium]
MRALKWLAVTAGVALLALVLGVLGVLQFQNVTYARTLFSNLVAYDRVLYSRRWHPLLGGPFGCTYAVVSLAETAPTEPAEEADSGGRRQFRWGGNWQPTPASPPNPERHNGVDCINRFDAATAERIAAAMREPGSWYVRRAGGILFLYSPPQRIAVRLRHGD